MNETEEKRESKYAKYRDTLSGLNVEVRYSADADAEEIDAQVEVSIAVRMLEGINRIKNCVTFLAVLAAIGVIGGIILYFISYISVRSA